jgi:hypothetical protein
MTSFEWTTKGISVPSPASLPHGVPSGNGRRRGLVPHKYSITPATGDGPTSELPALFTMAASGERDMVLGEVETFFTGRGSSSRIAVHTT